MKVEAQTWTFQVSPFKKTATFSSLRTGQVIFAFSFCFNGWDLLDTEYYYNRKKWGSKMLWLEQSVYRWQYPQPAAWPIICYLKSWSKSALFFLNTSIIKQFISYCKWEAFQGARGVLLLCKGKDLYQPLAGNDQVLEQKSQGRKNIPHMQSVTNYRLSAGEWMWNEVLLIGVPVFKPMRLNSSEWINKIPAMSFPCNSLATCQYDP